MAVINETIEGFNESGICMACLNYGRKMTRCSDAVKYFKILCNIDVSKGVDVLLCWQCHANIHHIDKFQRQITNSYSVLADYARLNKFLSDPEEVSRHAKVSLTTSTLNPTIYVESAETREPESCVKSEIEADFKFEVKPETDQINPSPPNDDDDDRVDDESFDEDLPLMKRKSVKFKKRPAKRECDKRRSERALRCYLCRCQFENAEELKEHRKNCDALKRNSVICDCCNRSFVCKKNLLMHLRQMSNKTEEEPKCNICNRTFSNKKTLMRHSEVHDGKEHKCHLCNQKFLWKSNLKRHMRCHEDKMAGRRYECNICDRRLGSLASFKRHIKYNKGHGNVDYCYKCEQCNMSFLNKQKLADHVDWDHLKIFKYKCHICQKAFKTALSMTNHVKYIHEGSVKKKYGYEASQQHLCDICGKSYKFQSLLEDHKTVHSDTATFPCNVCGKLFKKQSSLKTHAYMHRGQSYECAVCGKAFNNPSNRDRHVKYVHKEVRDVKCDFCEKCFKSEADKKLHSKYVHLKQPWPKRVRGAGRGHE